MRTFLLYSAVLVGAYLVLSNSPGFVRSVGAVAGGASDYARTLQGR